MSTQRQKSTPKSALTRTVEEMQSKIDDPLRNDVIKARQIAGRTRFQPRRISRVLKRLSNGDVDGVNISKYDGKRSDENRLYKIESIESIPITSLFITEYECKEFRRKIVNTDKRLRDVSANSNYSKSVIRSHITGKCSHNHNQPPTQYDRKNEVWIERDNQP